MFEFCFLNDNKIGVCSENYSNCINCTVNSGNEMQCYTSNCVDIESENSNGGKIPSNMNDKFGLCSAVSAHTKKKFVKLIGEKPIINIELNRQHCQGLWDTGSMVSLVSQKWLNRHHPNIVIKSINQFIGDHSQININAANGSSLNYVGVAELEFSSNSITFVIPFIVTQCHLDLPIIGYNVIEQLVISSPSTVTISKMLPNINKKRINAFVELVEANVDKEEKISRVKVKKVTKVPANTLMKVKCKAKLDPNMFGLDLLFQPDWHEKLMILESVDCRIRKCIQF